MSSLKPPLNPAVPDWSDQATDADVQYAYRFILRRPPDPEGLAYYQKLIARGLSFKELVRGFESSDELRRRREADARPIPVDLGGYQVCVQRVDKDFAQALLATHEYEPHVREAIRDHVHADDVVVDVGANVGCIALLAATLVGPNGSVLAVEPNPHNVQMLYAGIVLNGLSNIRVFPFAASNVSRVFSLTGGTSNTHLTDPQRPEGAVTYTQSVVLDELLSELPRLDLVKIDIEGHELQALEGCQHLIERFRPTLVVEFNPRCLLDLNQVEPRRMLDRLFGWYPAVRAVSAFGDDARFDDAAQLMAYWMRRNREVTTAGLLPDRLLHFDLIVERPGSLPAG